MNNNLVYVDDRINKIFLYIPEQFMKLDPSEAAIAGVQVCNYQKRDPDTGVFLWILRKPFLQNTSRRLLLTL